MVTEVKQGYNKENRNGQKSIQQYPQILTSRDINNTLKSRIVRCYVIQNYNAETQKLNTQ